MIERPAAWATPDPLPLPVATPRLLVDVYRHEDAPSLFAAVDGSRESLAAWLPWPRNDHRTPDESLARIRAFAKERGFAHLETLALGVFDRATRDVVGGNGLHRIDAAAGEAEIGYWTRADVAGQGLATEATAAVVGWAFGVLRLRRVVLRCLAANVASRRVAEKVGFRLERHEVACRWREGHGWCDELGFALLAEEWDARRAPSVPAG